MHHQDAHAHQPLGYKAALQVAVIWRGQDPRLPLLRRRSKVTVGPRKGAQVHDAAARRTEPIRPLTPRLTATCCGWRPS